MFVNTCLLQAERSSKQDIIFLSSVGFIDYLFPLWVIGPINSATVCPLGVHELRFSHVTWQMVVENYLSIQSSGKTRSERHCDLRCLLINASFNSLFTLLVPLLPLLSLQEISNTGVILKIAFILGAMIYSIIWPIPSQSSASFFFFSVSMCPPLSLCLSSWSVFMTCWSFLVLSRTDVTFCSLRSPPPPHFIRLLFVVILTVLLS